MYILTDNLQETLYIFSFSIQTYNSLMYLNIICYEYNYIIIPLNFDL